MFCKNGRLCKIGGFGGGFGCFLGSLAVLSLKGGGGERASRHRGQLPPLIARAVILGDMAIILI